MCATSGAPFALEQRSMYTAQKNPSRFLGRSISRGGRGKLPRLKQSLTLLVIPNKILLPFTVVNVFSFDAPIIFCVKIYHDE